VTGRSIPTSVTRLADTVLYEGLLLYPYRASSQKNAVRWQFGVLMPPGYAAADPSERSSCQAEFLIECLPEREPAAHVRVVLRFLQVRSRVVETVDPRTGAFRPVPSLEVGSDLLTTWDEALDREIEVSAPLPDLLGEGLVEPIRYAGSEQTEPVALDGDTADQNGGGARVRRREYPLAACVRVRAERLDTPFGVHRLQLRVDNVSPADQPAGTRDAALGQALIAAHLVVGLDGAAALSSQDPPEWAREMVAECTSLGLWPVLTGPEGRGEVVLATPIVLEDYPRLAPESPADLFDATEIDEILTLRTMVLTDEEKREVRATDVRAASLLDHVETLPGDLLERLHGAVRSLRPVGVDAEHGDPSRGDAVDAFDAPQIPWWDPGADASVSPGTDSLLIAGTQVSRGSRVRLRPGSRRADAQDLFLIGRIAVVEAVLFDVDGQVHLAVTPEDDPAADLNARHGRFLYFAPDEVEPLEVIS
jgi:hypothetical protein